MLYNLANINELDKFQAYVNQLVNQHCAVELSKYFPKRTLRQNKYFYLLLAYYGAYFGYTVEYVKEELFKRQVNKGIFKISGVDRMGNPYNYIRSSATLTTQEMTIAIERFRNWSAMEGGLYLPTPEEKDMLIYAQQMIDQNKEFL